jgi:hypothetical protein
VAGLGQRLQRSKWGFVNRRSVDALFVAPSYLSTHALNLTVRTASFGRYAKFASHPVDCTKAQAARLNLVARAEVAGLSRPTVKRVESE